MILKIISILFLSAVFYYSYATPNDCRGSTQQVEIRSEEIVGALGVESLSSDAKSKRDKFLDEVKIYLSTLYSMGMIDAKTLDGVFEWVKNGLDKTLLHKDARGHEDEVIKIWYEVFNKSKDRFLKKDYQKSIRENAKTAFDELDKTSGGLKTFLDPKVEFGAAMNAIRGVIKDGETISFNGIIFSRNGEKIFWGFNGDKKLSLITTESREKLITILNQIKNDIKD